MLEYTPAGQSQPLKRTPPAPTFTVEHLTELKDVEKDAMRDRVAYIHVTGCNPSHLRKITQDFLAVMTSFFKGPLPEPKVGPIVINPDVLEFLDIEAHPLVKKVNEFYRRGYRINVPGGERRRYSAVRMEGAINGKRSRITVQSDGSVLEGWA